MRPDDVLVLRNAGPIGGPGMPEWGFLPIPKKLLAAGVRDMVRISDARMSGTAFGTVVVHVSPGVGGRRAARRGPGWRPDRLDVPNRRLDLLVEPQEIARRLARVADWPRNQNAGTGGCTPGTCFRRSAGCDFDFLRAKSLPNAAKIG